MNASSNNRHPPGKRILALVSLVAGGAVACSAGERRPEPGNFDPVGRRMDSDWVYQSYRNRCLDGGYRIVIEASARVDADGTPNRGDRYYCAR